MDDNLGPTEPWTIRAFPRTLRDRLADDAHAQRITVGELLTAILVRHYDGEGAAAGSLERAVQLAPLLPHMPAWLRAALFRRVGAELGIEPPKPPPKRIVGNGMTIEGEG